MSAFVDQTYYVCHKYRQRYFVSIDTSSGYLITVFGSCRVLRQMYDFFTDDVLCIFQYWIAESITTIKSAVLNSLYRHVSLCLAIVPLCHGTGAPFDETKAPPSKK